METVVEVAAGEVGQFLLASSGELIDFVDGMLMSPLDGGRVGCQPLVVTQQTQLF